MDTRNTRKKKISVGLDPIYINCLDKIKMNKTIINRFTVKWKSRVTRVPD